MDWKRIIGNGLIKYKTSKTINPMLKWLHIIGWIAFTASVYYFLTSNYQGDIPITVAFIQLMSGNILLSGLWPRGGARKRDFLYNFIFFAIQTSLLAFILFPDRNQENEVDLLLILSWIPLVAVFTFINFFIVKRINKRVK